MKDQKLYNIFHSYHPEMSSEEDFMARLEEKMKASPKESETGRSGSPLLWRGRGRLRLFLPWLSGIAAAVAVGLFLFKPLYIPLPWEREFAAEVPLSHRRGVRGEAVPERIAMQTMDADPLASFEETVAEIEQSGQQLQLAIAEMKK
ncbi:MAG: hypothetical protein IJL50_10770 [Bacteroidaceae bacterium]|nr:hypothetical protein [Bacteroidaceae bacterium]